MKNLKALSYKLREDAVNIIMAGGGGHIGGDMSVMDILMELYLREMNFTPDNQDKTDRDHFLLSKGHAMEAYYAVLCEAGFLDLKEVTEQFSKFGSKYIGHPNNHLPGIEMNSGSLGHGLSDAVGMALAGKMDQKDYRVYVVIGDGELAEGSVWEGFMAAGHYKLNNLCAVIDFNNLQISGTLDEVMTHRNIAKQAESFEWNVIETDGHDFEKLHEAFQKAREMKGKPTCIIAHTIKGYGASIMENKVSWHHHLPDEKEYQCIMKELEERKEAAGL